MSQSQLRLVVNNDHVQDDGSSVEATWSATIEAMLRIDPKNVGAIAIGVYGHDDGALLFQGAAGFTFAAGNARTLAELLRALTLETKRQVHTASRMDPPPESLAAIKDRVLGRLCVPE